MQAMIDIEHARAEPNQLAMRDGTGAARRKMNLFNARILLIEDDYLLAFELRNELVRRGAQVIGPFAKVDLAWDLARSARSLDAAVVDINLHGEFSFPVVDELIRRDVPVIFWTGYDADVLPYRQRHVTRVLKPASVVTIADTLSSMLIDLNSTMEQNAAPSAAG